MTDRPRTTLAVYLLLRRADELLFIRRCNSGWQDGRLTLVAGHVDPGESARSAMVREAAEEVGIDVDPDALELVHTMHRNGPNAYVDLYFACRRWAGEAKIREPEMAVDLTWTRLIGCPAMSSRRCGQPSGRSATAGPTRMMAGAGTSLRRRHLPGTARGPRRLSRSG